MENIFQPLSIDELSKTLGLTIKKDEENKIVTFLCQLSAYTENCQFNISFNAPSSTGKSYIPLEISSLFPKEDVMRLGNVSPNAFFHEEGKYNKEDNTITVDLARKILIFLDQPKPTLVERLRSLLSHDLKEMHSKITDKNARGGNRTKNVIIKGYPSVIFCSAGLKMDEQETTRFILLSPDIDQEKIRESVIQKIRKEADNAKFKTWLEELPDRKALMERIRAIKEAHIDEIKVMNPEKIEERFLAKNKILKSRHSRDIGRLLDLIKAIALLNMWHRDKQGSTITANEQDMDEAFRIWDKISVSQELNLPPYVYQFYQKIILPLWDEREIDYLLQDKQGLNRQEIQEKHFEVYGRTLDPAKLGNEILRMMETAGLIEQEPDRQDRRKILIRPTLGKPKSHKRRNMGFGDGFGGFSDGMTDIGSILRNRKNV